MTPYWQDLERGLTIYHGDCRDVLPRIEGIDLVLTDPPYGNGTNYGKYLDTTSNLERLIKDTFPLLRQKSERVVLTPGVLSQYKWPVPTWTLAWLNTGNTASSCWGFSCWQPILAYGTDPYLANGLGRRPDAFYASKLADSRPTHINHPVPKRISLWSWLLVRVSALKNDTVSDPFMGSGTTLVAAKQFQRPAIGIEIEERYCEIAALRLENTPVLPFPPEPPKVEQANLFP